MEISKCPLDSTDRGIAHPFVAPVRERPWYRKLGKGDRIRYCTAPDGRVYIEPVRAAEGDPALGAFLDFIEADIAAHPERLKAYDGALHDRLRMLVGDVDIDLGAPLSPEDE